MARKFSYRAKDPQGKTLEGIMEVNTQEQVIRALRSRGLIIVSVEEEQESEVAELLSRFQRVKVDDVVNFTRQLSTMVSAGLTLTEGLSILKVQSSPAMSRVIGKIAEGIEGGAALAAAMEKAGKGVFAEVYLALVKAGEAAGVLDEILNRLATNLEKQRDFRNKTKGAMVYPVIVLSGMVIVGSIMMIFVVPQMTAMYKDFGADLPLPTQILIGVSDFMVRFWYILLFGLLAGAYFFRKWAETDVGGVMVEEAIFKTPVIGPLRRTIVMTEFTRTMGLLVGAGISILDALRITAAAVGSRIIEGKILDAAERVEKGRPLGAVLPTVGGFPPIVAQMIAVGEQTGKVDEILNKLANYFEGESETAVKALTTALEPLILVVMGVGVGFLVMAVIMPIYNLTSQF